MRGWSWFPSFFLGFFFCDFFGIYASHFLGQCNVPPPRTVGETDFVYSLATINLGCMRVMNKQKKPYGTLEVS